MKKINLLVVFIILTVNLNAQWTRTHVDVIDTGVEAICEHNGSLYASIYGKGLIKYDNATSQWLEVADNLPPTGNSAHIVNLASSGNYLYAYVNDQFHASTTIYRSTDSGQTFETDTVGHPRYGSFPTSTAGYPMIVHDVYVLDGRLYNVMGGSGYTKLPSDPAWVPIADPNIKFAESFAEYSNTWYAIYLNNFYTSIDDGVTWVASANSGLTTGFTSTYLNVNPASGRIYARNTPGPFDVQKLYYSDNEGATWDSLHINQYIEPAALGGNQSIKGMISNGSDLTLMLSNNATNTVIDVWKSTDGGQSFSPDTVGLPNDQFGSTGFVDFVYFNEKLWFAPNAVDIYVQDAAAAGVQDHEKLNAKVYPNPASNSLTIENDMPLESITVFNSLGEIIEMAIPNSKMHFLDLSAIPNGIYMVRITSNKQTETVKIVKN